MNRVSRFCFGLVALLASGLAGAPAMAQTPSAQMLESLAALLPGTSPDRVEASPLPGLFEVTFGPNIIYVSADGQYVLHGDLIDLAKRTNLTEAKRGNARVAAIDKLGEDSMIVFSPSEAEPEHIVTVFTDVSCGYCAKLHAEMDQLNELGIAVRYLAFPRAGVHSGTYDTMVSVWCADDQQTAMTDAKQRRQVEPATCTNPVASHYTLGQLFGVNGTPTIVLENGDIVPGYLPPRRLLQRLEEG